jgi:isoamylase
MFYG